MKGFTIKNAAEACGAEICGRGDLSTLLGEIIIDSRLVKNSDLFVAFKGEKTDGHRYISTALDKGAACCLAEYVPAGEERCILLVDDVQSALEKIAEAYRATLDIPLIGITGSVGKTTAKEMIWAVLNRKYKTHKNRMNFNNEISLPLKNILYIESYDKICEIHTNLPQPKYTVRQPLNEAVNRLADKGFVQIHKSYVVNMQHITKLKNYTITLSDYTALPAAQKRWQDIMQKYLEWKGNV